MITTFSDACAQTLALYQYSTENGKWILPLFLCFILIFCLAPAGQHRQLKNWMLYPSIVMLVFFWNPLVLWGISQVVDLDRLYRLYWMLPVELVAAYCMTWLLQSIEKPQKKVLFVGMSFAVIVIMGGFAFTANSYSTTTNWYKIPNYTLDICQQIEDTRGDAEAKVAVPPEVTYYIRQYDTSIKMPYGMQGRGAQSEEASALYDALDQDVIDLGTVAALAQECGCGYLVLNATKQTTGTLENSGFTAIADIEGGYTLYKAGAT